MSSCRPPARVRLALAALLGALALVGRVATAACPSEPTIAHSSPAPTCIPQAPGPAIATSAIQSMQWENLISLSHTTGYENREARDLSTAFDGDVATFSRYRVAGFNPPHTFWITLTFSAPQSVCGIRTHVDYPHDGTTFGGMAGVWVRAGASVETAQTAYVDLELHGNCLESYICSSLGLPGGANYASRTGTVPLGWAEHPFATGGEQTDVSVLQIVSGSTGCLSDICSSVNEIEILSCVPVAAEAGSTCSFGCERGYTASDEQLACDGTNWSGSCDSNLDAIAQETFDSSSPSAIILSKADSGIAFRDPEGAGAGAFAAEIAHVDGQPGELRVAPGLVVGGVDILAAVLALNPSLAASVDATVSVGATAASSSLLDVTQGGIQWPHVHLGLATSDSGALVSDASSVVAQGYDVLALLQALDADLSVGEQGVGIKDFAGAGIELPLQDSYFEIGDSGVKIGALSDGRLAVDGKLVVNGVDIVGSLLAFWA